MRQAWQGVFRPASLQGYSKLMNSSAARMCSTLAGAAKAGSVVEIYRLFGALTMEIIGATGYKDVRSPLLN